MPSAADASMTTGGPVSPNTGPAARSNAVPDAGTIVVGTVEGLKKQETHARFRLRIDEVLRSHAPATMRFSGLSGGEARSACGDRNYVVARDGDWLALAMGAAVPDEPLEVETVAFVGDSTPDRRSMRKMEQLTLWKVRKLAGRAPDVSPVASRATCFTKSDRAPRIDR